MEKVGQVIGGVVGGAFLTFWYGCGAYGLWIVVRKGYWAILGDLGCLAWILFGWWGLIIFLALGIGLGPITLLIARGLEPRRRCPHCKQIIPGSATRCPHCGGQVEPIVPEAEKE